MTTLAAEGINKRYQRAGCDFYAVKEVDLVVEQGDFVVITGHSGSGKSTLLNMLAGLLRPDSGSVRLGGQDLTEFSDTALALLRATNIGYIPQGRTILDNFSVLDNICLPYDLAHQRQQGKTLVQEKAYDLLSLVGISHLLDERPHNLSGGEQRRVAIARSLINEPDILIADEPTSDLDPTTTNAIMDLFEKIHREGTTVIMVTHDWGLTRYATVGFTMLKGLLIEGNA
ncbi:MAG: ABC transporter ATP-binding protein [Coriobacteriales bacterium]|jgi:putative ABC transport system ATP-binding protein|nr:ABC transporter ATP-binding protein [Coriobacteriales bacterium]